MSWLFCGPAGPSRFACKRFMRQHTYWSKSHYRRFIKCCLSAPLPASARLGAGAGLLVIQMWRVSFAWLAAIMISGLLASSTSHSRRCIALSEWAFEGMGVSTAFEGLGLQVGALMMSSNWNVEDISAKYWSNPAEFRDLIREIKQRTGLGWSWTVQMVIGTSSSDWNVDDATAKKFKQSCQCQRWIKDGTTIVLLDSLVDPQSNWFEIEFLSDRLPTEWVTSGLPTGLILLDWEMESSLYCT